MQTQPTSSQPIDAPSPPVLLRFFIFMHRYVIPLLIAALLLGLLVALLVETRLGALGSPLFYLTLLVFGIIMAFFMAGARAARRMHEREPGALRSMRGWLLLAVALTVANASKGLIWPSAESEVPRLFDIVSLLWYAGWYLVLSVSRQAKEVFEEKP